MSDERGQSEGPATDRNNQPVIDPTANVLDLVEAAIKRIDDIREVETRRVDDLRESFLKHIEVVSMIRAHYEDELRVSESKRIDAVRTVDVAAVAAAASAAETRATALAQQVSASAEAMRNQVAAAAQAASTALTAALEPIQKDVADLRRVQYEQQGQRANIEDRRATWTAGQGMVVAAILVVTAILAIYAAIHRGASSTPTPSGGTSAVVCTAAYHPASICPAP